LEEIMRYPFNELKLFIYRILYKLVKRKLDQHQSTRDLLPEEFPAAVTGKAEPPDGEKDGQ